MSELENSGDPAPVELEEVAGGPLPSDMRRRRLVKSAIATGSVILTLKGQSAMAAVGCASPSRIISGVPSQTPGTPQSCGLGWSPGYWKVCQHHSEWSGTGVTVATFSPACSNGNPDFSKVTDEGTKFGAIFPPSGALANYGCLRILKEPTAIASATGLSTNVVQLARHLIATYLNSKKVANFPLTDQQIQDMWVAGFNGTGYCPTSVTCTQPWNVTTTVCYLRNYTMDPATMDNPPWVCASVI